MLIKPDRLPSLTASCRPIRLLSTIMKLFKRVIEKRLRKHLEDTGFLSKYQSAFRKAKSTNDHLFRPSQTVMESSNRGEQVITSFLDAEKPLTMFGIMDSGIKFPARVTARKATKWLSDFLVESHSSKSRRFLII